MKVILVNGSPHAEGCTYTALKEVEKALNADGVETDFFSWALPRFRAASGAAFAAGRANALSTIRSTNLRRKRLPPTDLCSVRPCITPPPGGAMTSFMDRAFYSGGKSLWFKPAAAVVSCRRAGSTAAFDMMNKYFTISSMPVVSSTYWNEVHGSNPEDVFKDEEGLQTMRALGHNMAWLLGCIAAGRKAGLEPVREKKIYTNFVR